MTAGGDLRERVRDLLDDRPMREQPMFGGVSFMVEERLLVAAGRDGSLLVRVDPDRSAELLTRPGAEPARMGQRDMGPGWLRVEADGVESEDDLRSWLDVALEFHAVG